MLTCGLYAFCGYTIHQGAQLLLVNVVGVMVLHQLYNCTTLLIKHLNLVSFSYLLQPGNVPIAVVISQPPSYVVHADRYSHGDHYFMLSIILSIICFCCGSWLSLLCTIPAIVFAAAVSFGVHW